MTGPDVRAWTQAIRQSASVSLKTEVVTLYAFPEFGCYLGVTQDDGSLVFAPTDAVSGKPDLESLGDVSNDESPENGPDFLTTVNAFFGTTFTAEQFAGRC